MADNEPAFWGDEHGDYFFYEKHVGVVEMRTKAIEFERECIDSDLDQDRIDDINSWESHQYWVKWDPNDDEAPGELVKASTPGAVPCTGLG